LCGAPACIATLGWSTRPEQNEPSGGNNHQSGALPQTRQSSKGNVRHYQISFCEKGSANLGRNGKPNLLAIVRLDVTKRSLFKTDNCIFSLVEAVEVEINFTPKFWWYINIDYVDFVHAKIVSSKNKSLFFITSYFFECLGH